MKVFDVSLRLFMKVSVAYGVVAFAGLFDSGSYTLPETPKPAVVVQTEVKNKTKVQLDAEAKAKADEKATQEYEFRTMTEHERKREELSAKEAEALNQFERFFKRIPHFIRKWNREFIPYEAFIVLMVGCVLSVLATTQWVVLKVQGRSKLAD